MLLSFIPLVILSLCVGLGAWFVFMWAVRSGQYDDIEGPKHRMLDDDDREPGPDTKDHKDTPDQVRDQEKDGGR